MLKYQPDATVCRYLFNAKSLYMFRVSYRPSSGVLKTVTAASGTVHNTGTATSLQRGLIRPLWREVAVYLRTVASGWIFINIELHTTFVTHMYYPRIVNVFCILMYILNHTF